jgi:lipid-A-disaccharide synthase
MWIGLLPGSRSREIRDNLPEMLKAARKLQSAEHAAQTFEFIVPLAPTLNLAQEAEVLEMVKTLGEGLSIRLVDDARATLLHSRASVVASGTATVEAALIGNPFVVVYRVSAVTFAIAKRVVKVAHVAMANLIAGKRVVPELLQHDFTAANIVQQLEPLLPDGAARESMMQELKAIGAALGSGRTEDRQGAAGTIERVAAITLEELGPAAAEGNELAVQS